MNLSKLEYLNKTDWDHLGARDVPEILEGLVSKQQDVRHEAYSSLVETVVQPDMFEGYGTLQDILKNELQTIVARFLRTILENVELSNKEYALRLLSGLCAYFTLEEVTEPYKIRLDDLRREISSGISTYLSLFDDPEQAVRQAAIVLVERIPEHSSLFVEHLLQRMNDEISAELKMLSIWKVFSKLNDDIALRQNFESTFISLLNVYVENGVNDRVKCVAAVCLANILMENTSPQAIKLIEDNLRVIQNNDTILGYEWGHDRYRLTHALTLLEKQKGKAALKDILNSESTSILSVFHALNGLLHLEFGTGDLAAWYLYEHTFPTYRFVGVKLTEDFSKPPNIVNLNVAQTELIRDVLEVSRIFDVQTNVFEIYGLPNSYEHLALLIS